MHLWTAIHMSNINKNTGFISPLPVSPEGLYVYTPFVCLSVILVVNVFPNTKAIYFKLGIIVYWVNPL